MYIYIFTFNISMIPNIVINLSKNITIKTKEKLKQNNIIVFSKYFIKYEFIIIALWTMCDFLFVWRSKITYEVRERLLSSDPDGVQDGAEPALTVKETTERKKAAREGKFKRGWETPRRRRADKAWFEVKSGCDLCVCVHESMY